ncbi:hypothetical protein BD769DRAFT_1630034 [Suillus cothurnatus]|nr:hypothetical protein BD769DRAFT_1630034 [Suillus cothurnatus]
MEVILKQPGYISIKMGSEKLRTMFQTRDSGNWILITFTFAFACMTGQIEDVKAAVTGGVAPDITGAETPFKIGFLSFTVLGAQRIRGATPNSLKHLDCGAPPDLSDISGHTALHHACTPPLGHLELAKALLEGGANPNVQNRYGEEAIREKALWEEKECEYCKKKGVALKRCARCHTVRYCSSDCQRTHWKTHKPLCQPFSTSTTVTLKPTYGNFSSTISRADFTREALGLSSPKSKPSKNPPRLTQMSFDQKSMIIKVQVPVDSFSPTATSMGLDFMCPVQRAGNTNAYDDIVRVVKSRGVGGGEGLFAAELRTRDELVVKISETLAEQPF